MNSEIIRTVSCNNYDDFYFIFEAQQQTQPDKPLAPSSQAHWPVRQQTFHLHTSGVWTQNLFEV
jgi:hypothetical protein